MSVRLGTNIIASKGLIQSGGGTWGSITGTLSNQTDLQSALDAKQATLTAGTNVSITNNTISATDTTYTAGTDIDITNNQISFNGTIPTKTSDLTNDSNFITKSVNDLTNYTLSSDFGTMAFADAVTNGDISGTINQDKITNLTTDLAGKQATITSSAMLSADLVDDSSATNKFVTASDKTTWNAKQDALPTLESGKFLTNDGSSLAWGAVSGGAAPTGAITAFGGSTAPDGWLICNGGAISRTTYSALFAVIGTTYGSGDGSTTFNLPNLEARIPTMRSDLSLGATGDGELPNITGSIEVFADSTDSGTSDSALYKTTKTDTTGIVGSNSQLRRDVNFDASRSSSAYSRSDNYVLPRYLATTYVIKY